MTTDILTIDMFRDRIGQAFVIEEAEHRPIELTLIEATLAHQFAPHHRQTFSLLFTSQPGILIPQRTYALQHPELGLLSIFLVPISQSEDKATYQAIFN